MMLCTALDVWYNWGQAKDRRSACDAGRSTGKGTSDAPRYYPDCSRPARHSPILAKGRQVARTGTVRQMMEFQVGVRLVGMVTVDDIDADIADDRWYTNTPGYGTIQYAFMEQNGRKTYMHRVILERIIGCRLDEGEQVDHRNRNGMDNRRGNLRLSSQAQNRANTTPRGISIYRGVWWDRKRRKWHAEVWKNRKRMWRARFCDEIEAAKARDRIAFAVHGEFAMLNFPAPVVVQP